MQATRGDSALPQDYLSVVMTAYNEGDEVRATIRSIVQSTALSVRIHLVDDGSTDGCCTGFDQRGVEIVSHPNRIGIAASRIEAVNSARGAVVAIMDAHQRLESGCLDRCAELALKYRSIVTPDICGFDDDVVLHGAFFTHDVKRNIFGAEWKKFPPSSMSNKISSLRAPLYLIPREVYPKVCWSRALRGWGGSEANISLKAFFTGIDLLHLCGPLARHKFKSRFHYYVDWPEVWRNHAILARICFSERTWYEYWLPEVFDSKLTDTAKADLESDLVRDEHAEFQKIKVRCDVDFWNQLIFEEVPLTVRSKV